MATQTTSRKQTKQDQTTAPTADDQQETIVQDQTSPETTAPAADDQTTAPTAETTAAPAANPADDVRTAALSFVDDGGPLAAVHVAMLKVGRDDRPMLAATILADVSGAGDPAADDETKSARRDRCAEVAGAMLNPQKQTADPAVSLALALGSLHVAALALTADAPADVAARAGDLLALATADGYGPAPADVDTILAGAARAMKAARAPKSGTGGSGGTGTRSAVAHVVPPVGTEKRYTYNGTEYVLTVADTAGDGTWTGTAADGTAGSWTSPTAAVKGQTGQKSVNGWRTLGL